MYTQIYFILQHVEVLLDVSFPCFCKLTSVACNYALSISMLYVFLDLLTISFQCDQPAIPIEEQNFHDLLWFIAIQCQLYFHEGLFLGWDWELEVCKWVFSVRYMLWFIEAQNVKVPMMVFHFKAHDDVSLPARNYLILVDSASVVFCFAFARNIGGLSIIGNI